MPGSSIKDAINNLQKHLAEHSIAVSQLERLAHTNLVLVTSAMVDQALREAMEKRMAHISSTMKRKLFDGYGSLSNISPKMDVCFAFSIIDKEIYTELKILNKIRTKFAHSAINRSFADQDIIDLVKQLPSKPDRDFNAVGSCQEVVKDVLNRLTAYLDSAASSA